jgi:hypothetical protein
VARRPRDWRRIIGVILVGLVIAGLVAAIIYFQEKCCAKTASTVAQLGRALGSGQAPNEYAHVLPRGLTCFFIGKLVERALSQVFLK